MTIGERIKEIRKNKKMTQKELASKLGISFQALAQWENNLRNPKQESLERIAEALEVTTDYLKGKTNRPDTRLSTQEDIDRYFGGTSFVTEDGVAILSTQFGTLSHYFNKLNEIGRHEAIKRVKELSQIPEYQKKDEPGQE